MGYGGSAGWLRISSSTTAWSSVVEPADSPFGVSGGNSGLGELGGGGRGSARRGGCRSNDRTKGVIDGELVAKFADLSLADQEDLASAIGSTVELIMDNILDIRCCGMVV